MEKKPLMTSPDLWALLDRELRRRKPRECAGCFVSFPFRVEVREQGASNWEVVIPHDCGHGCRDVLEEILLEFQLRYDLADAENL